MSLFNPVIGPRPLLLSGGFHSGHDTANTTSTALIAQRLAIAAVKA